MSTRIEGSRWRTRGRLLAVGVLMAALAAAGCEGADTPAEREAPAPQAPAAQAAVPDVTLYPGELERGADTPLLHIEEEVIVDGDLRIPIDGPTHLWLMGRIGPDYLIYTASDDFDHYTVQLVQRNGDRRVLQRFGQRTTATMSADGSHLALATSVRPDTRVRVVWTRSGRQVRERTFASYGAEVSDYGRRRMVITGPDSKTYWWNPGTNRLSLIVPRPAGAHITADRLVVMVPDPETPYEDCQKTVRLSDPTDVLWRSCKDIPLEFSPDASRMVTVPILSDGIGPRDIEVRKAGGGLVATYRAPMWFGFTDWESDTALVLQPVGKTFLAAVRCDLAGQCERASRLYRSPGTYDPPSTMRWSFPS